MKSLLLFGLLSIWLTGHCISGQKTQKTQQGFVLPACDTTCPVNKRCVQDNATVVWELFSSNECKTYQACYGSNSRYPDDTNTNIFAGRFYPVVISLGSSVYFEAKYSGGLLKPLTVYNVSQGNFLGCKNATQSVGTLVNTVKVADKFVSSLGYKFFIAKSKAAYLPCNVGLRLHMNVKDATNCSGSPRGKLCSGKGRCISESFTGDMHCECCAGYSGRFCEELDACYMAPCKRGNCSDIKAGLSPDFNCTCDVGYTGQLCDIDINECNLPDNAGVCQHGGFCDDGINSYNCFCLNGFCGRHCEIISNMCESIKPCKNNANCNGVCINKEPSYVCQCTQGFYGRNCTLNATTSSVKPQISDIAKTSSFYATSSVILSVGQTFISSSIFQVTASDGYTTVFLSTASSSEESHSYSSLETGLFTQGKTRWKSGSPSTSILPSTNTSPSTTMLPSTSLSPSDNLLLTSSQPLTEQLVPTQTIPELVSSPSSQHRTSHRMSLPVSTTRNIEITSRKDMSTLPTPTLVSTKYQPPSLFEQTATIATSMVEYHTSLMQSSSTPALSSITTPSRQLPSSHIISPSHTTVTAPSSTVVPTTLPFKNQTCSDGPCGEHGVCTDRHSLSSDLPFHCDCQYPTVGPICTTDLELHFPYFSGKSYIQFKPIAFGSRVNKFVISFYSDADGVILFSAHRTYQDFIKLEVIGGHLRFSVDAGDKVVSVTSQENVTNGNTTAASFGYDTRTGSVFLSVNNGVEERATTRGKLRDVQLFHPLYLGGIVPEVYTKSKRDVGVIKPFIGCIRELEFNERALELSAAVDWQNISECDVPACKAKPCKNSGTCVQDMENVNEYSCQCLSPYSGKNCGEKYACQVNVCNGGQCLNSSSSGVKCLCPLGRAGVSCNEDIQVSTPMFSVVKEKSSYLRYLTPRAAVSQLDIRMEIKFANVSQSRGDGLLFYVGLHDQFSVGSDGDYLTLGVIDNRMVLQFNLGSGGVNLTSDVLSSEHKWFTILAGRKGRDGYLYVDNDVNEARSPPPLEGLNVFGHLYLGGVPEFSLLNSEVVFTEGFRGSIKDPKVRTGISNSWLSLTMEHSTNATGLVAVESGLNIQDQKVNTCVVGACLNNGTCESLGASYFCRCPPEWSGMTCNDSSVPCRDYNPCHGVSTCRMFDSGFMCDCPLGKAGRYCENAINITTPMFGEYSYLKFPLAKIKIFSQTSVDLVFSTPAANAILFYVTRDITSASGDFLSITLHERHVYLIYDLGTGVAKCRSQNTIRIKQNNEIVVTRNARSADLQVNGNRTSCVSQGGATQLNVASEFYLGGVPDLSQVQPRAYENSKDLRDFTGCVEQLRVNGHSFDLTQQGVQEGRNVVNCNASLLQL